MNPPDTRIINSRSASKAQKSQQNFFTLPLLCQKKNAPQIERIHVRQIEYRQFTRKIPLYPLCCSQMAGIKGKSGPEWQLLQSGYWVDAPKALTRQSERVRTLGGQDHKVS